MKELNFLKIIKEQLSDSSYIGDDCAFLDDLDLYVTQDTLVEDIHFSLYTISPYLLGRKAVAVNLSDLAASLSKPLYILVSLSLNKNTEDKFVSELYRGINDICSEYNVKVIGGDITGSEKNVISVCAIGKKNSLYSVSRSFAKKNYSIYVTGQFGASSAGLYSLSHFLYADKILIDSHLNPVPRIKEAEKLSKIINSDIAVMDCSDGLIDALYKIADASKHSVKIDINSVPISDALLDFSKQNNLDYKEFIKWGGEDYELLICVPDEISKFIDKNTFTYIGKVLNKDNNPEIIIKDGSSSEKITADIFEKNSYNHF